MLERNEASSDSGCETDSLPPPEAEGAEAQLPERRQEYGPLSLDKALGFVDFDSTDFDEVSLLALVLVFFVLVSFFLLLFLAVRLASTSFLVFVSFEKKRQKGLVGLLKKV